MVQRPGTEVNSCWMLNVLLMTVVAENPERSRLLIEPIGSSEKDLMGGEGGGDKRLKVERRTNGQ